MQRNVLTGWRNSFQTRRSMATRKRGALKNNGKVALPERIIQKLKQHSIVAFLIAIGTIIIAVGNFFGAVSKIQEFFRKQTEVKPTTVGELQDAVRATSIELKQAFDSVTAGRTPPVPERDFRRVLDLIAKIE